MAHRSTLTVAIALVAFLATACVDGSDPVASAEELGELDAWATTADGKSDLPSTWSELVSWLKDVYRNRMSAIWNDQEHPATAAAALDRIRRVVTRTGGDPARTLYPVTVQRHVAEVDHSELNIKLPGGSVVRLVGDPKGAGAFFDHALFRASVGPRLCLTWDELRTAVESSYVAGAYGVDYVCHTVTERVLRALGVGTAPYSGQYRTYAAARWIWGPVVPSFNSQDPAEWAVSRSCD